MDFLNVRNVQNVGVVVVHDNEGVIDRRNSHKFRLRDFVSMAIIHADSEGLKRECVTEHSQLIGEFLCGLCWFLHDSFSGLSATSWSDKSRFNFDFRHQQQIQHTHGTIVVIEVGHLLGTKRDHFRMSHNVLVSMIHQDTKWTERLCVNDSTQAVSGHEGGLFACGFQSQWISTVSQL